MAISSNRSPWLNFIKFICDEKATFSPSIWSAIFTAATIGASFRIPAHSVLDHRWCFQSIRCVHEKPSPLLGQFEPRLRVRVVKWKVIYDHRNRKCNCQHTANCAYTADKLAYCGSGRHVTVPDSCHGNNGPPKAVRNVSEFCIFSVFLPVIDQTSEQHHSN